MNDTTKTAMEVICALESEIEALKAIITNQELTIKNLVGEQEQSNMYFVTSFIKSEDGKAEKRRFTIPQAAVIHIVTPEGGSMDVTMNIDGKTLEIFGKSKLVMFPKSVNHIQVKNSYI